MPYMTDNEKQQQQYMKELIDELTHRVVVLEERILELERHNDKYGHNHIVFGYY